MQSDPTKPNSARIYDYMLGGKHNYPADRAAAKQLLQALPESRQGVYLYRYFLLEAVRRLSKANLTCYLDLATGIPTEGYIHERAPQTARIVYNDIDPETIAYAREIVADKPNILCIQSDLREIDVILAQAEDFFRGERRIGICMVGVVYFIEDHALAHVFQRLYEWSASGSMLAINSFESYDLAEWPAGRFYKSIGVNLYGRNPEHLLRLAAPWRPLQDLDQLETYAERNLPGFDVVPSEAVRGQVGYGGILIHP
jgi:O-methyltransferase involved in polyketide biosynthesis